MDFLLFLIFLAACFGAGATGALFPPGEWYERLEKPSWTPPNWVFPVTWTILYLLIAFAGARVASMEDSAYAMAFWSLQIALNGLWTPVFFGLRRLRAAIIVVLALWVSVLGGMITHFLVDPYSGLAFLPYLIWVSVAAALNVRVADMNPDIEAYDPGAIEKT